MNYPSEYLPPEVEQELQAISAEEEQAKELLGIGSANVLRDSTAPGAARLFEEIEARLTNIIARYEAALTRIPPSAPDWIRRIEVAIARQRGVFDAVQLWRPMTLATLRHADELRDLRKNQGGT